MHDPLSRSRRRRDARRGRCYGPSRLGQLRAAKPFTIRGQVETLRWQNPHVHVDVKHQGARWEAVLAPPFRMEARGLQPDMIKAGTMVALEGYASTRVEREMRAERITVNGKAVELR